MISNLAGINNAKATFATLPLPGIKACIVDENGLELGPDINQDQISFIRDRVSDHQKPETQVKENGNLSFGTDSDLQVPTYMRDRK